MKFLKYLFFAPFILGGIFAIVFAFKQKESNEKFFAKAEPVDAIIDDIVTRTVRKSTGKKRKTTTEHDVYVTYTVDDVEYKHVKISSYTSSMVEGKTIRLYYDPQDPRDIRHKETSETAVPLMIGVGSVFVIVGLAIPLSIGLSGHKITKLMKTGIRCQAEEICIEENRNVRVNGKHPCVLYCRALDPRDNNLKEFKSGNCYEDLYEYDINNVDIYLDPNNINKYYVDLKGAIKEAKESRF
jgi:hypothetical protein